MNPAGESGVYDPMHSQLIDDLDDIDDIDVNDTATFDLDGIGVNAGLRFSF